MQTKVCSRCGVEKALGAFYDKHAMCKACSGVYDRERYGRKRSEIIGRNLQYYRTHTEQYASYRRKRYTENRAKITKYLQSHPCADCGISDIRVLQFHHIEKPAYRVRSMLLFKWEKIQMEIAKCVVLCANCHCIRHYEETSD